MTDAQQIEALVNALAYDLSPTALRDIAQKLATIATRVVNERDAAGQGRLVDDVLELARDAIVNLVLWKMRAVHHRESAALERRRNHELAERLARYEVA